MGRPGIVGLVSFFGELVLVSPVLLFFNGWVAIGRVCRGVGIREVWGVLWRTLIWCRRAGYGVLWVGYYVLILVLDQFCQQSLRWSINHKELVSSNSFLGSKGLSRIITCSFSVLRVICTWLRFAVRSAILYNCNRIRSISIRLNKGCSNRLVGGTRIISSTSASNDERVRQLVSVPDRNGGVVSITNFRFNDRQTLPFISVSLTIKIGVARHVIAKGKVAAINGSGFIGIFVARSNHFFLISNQFIGRSHFKYLFN